MVLGLYIPNAFAYVYCSFVSVDNFHAGKSYSPLGSVKNNYYAVEIPAERCEGRNGEDVSGGVVLVLEDMGNENSSRYEIQRLWASLLLSAKTGGSKVSFHASQKGKNSEGKMVVSAYYLGAR